MGSDKDECLPAAELGRQNEALRQAKDKVDKLLAQYTDLYDFAPVGDLLLGRDGTILAANLTAANLLKVERHSLLGQRFGLFVVVADRPAFAACLEKIFTNPAKESCKVALAIEGDSPCCIQIVVAPAASGQECRIALIDITERTQLEALRAFLAQTSTAKADSSFFKKLARYLGESLDMDFVCIDRLHEDRLPARAVAVWRDGHSEDNVTCALKDNPCGDVVGKSVCCFPAQVCQLFPHNQVLQDLRAESFVGVTLWGHTGQPIGLIVVVGRKPLANPLLAESILKLAAARAANELERLDTEETLKASEEQHRAILQTALDGFWLVNRQGRLLEVNNAYCRMSGYSAQELLGMTVSDLEANETSADTEAHIRNAMEQTVDRFESRHRRKDGSIFDVAVSVQYLPANGECFVSFLQDISERKLSEAKLRKSEHLCTEAQRLAKLGSWKWDTITNKVTGSVEFYRIFGLFFSSYDDLQDLVHPDDRDRTHKAFQDAIARQLPYDIYYRIVHPPEGSIHFIHAQGETITDDNGTVVGMIGSTQDVSEQHQIEKQTAHLASFPQLNPNPVLEVNTDGRITFFNPTALKVLKTLGMEEAEIAAFLPADMEGILGSWDRLNEATLFRNIVIRNRDFSETIFLTPQFNAARIYAYDTTARKQAEKELQKAHDLMELKVSERTRELTKANAQLWQEIDERKKAETSLQDAFAEINQLKTRLQAENTYLRHEVAKEYNLGEIIGQSNAITQVFQRIEMVAPLQATVLILGETGTGKGLAARAIHDASTRKDRPMITVNCTALPANLIESELFGREKGAYTGADARQIGRFELADHGTIFLDEIGEMPLELQARLLRVVQDGEFERLGSPRTIKVDVRIIAASNRNLEHEIKGGRFREDLFYRLNVFPIKLPPLRRRAEDILLLVNHFVAKFNKKNGKKIETISPNTLEALQKYHWPGNVRELESVIERAVIISQGTVLHVLDRFDPLRQTDKPAGEDVKALVALEQDHILEVLQKTNWRIQGEKGAAKLLGINPSTLRSRMKKYGILRQQR